MLLQVTRLSIQEITVIVTAIIIISVLLYIGKILFKRSIDRQDKISDKRINELEEYTKLVNDLIIKVSNLITELKAYKEITTYKDKKISYQIGKNENELATLVTIEKEHYSELKGKVSKIHNRITDLENEIKDLSTEITKLRTEHNHNHGRGV